MDGGTRFCIDYRKLKAIQIKDANLFTPIEDSMGWTLGGKEMEETQQKSTFVTEGGLNQFKAMSFDPCGSPSTFE